MATTVTHHLPTRPSLNIHELRFDLVCALLVHPVLVLKGINLFLHLLDTTFVGYFTSMRKVLHGDDLVPLDLKLLNQVKLYLLLLVRICMLTKDHLFQLLTVEL